MLTSVSAPPDFHAAALDARGNHAGAPMRHSEPRSAVAASPVETALETTFETVSSPNSTIARTVSASPAPRLTPSSGRHLARFTRAKGSHRPPLALQDRDLDLLRTAHEYRLITTPQFLQLYREESPDAIYRRLQKLFHHGYLDRIGTNPNAPLVYALGKRGAEVLEVSHRKEGGDRYVAHQLMLGDFRVALTLAARERGVELAWRPAPSDAPVRPDGFFTLRVPDLPDGRNRAHFFLEADRSTMTRGRFVEKLRAYWSWCSSGGHTEKLGIKTFRVLTVTKSEERLRSLVDASRDSGALAPGLSHFWFSAEKAFTAGGGPSIFGAIWERLDRPGARQSLLP